jgi:hypothetical protein
MVYALVGLTADTPTERVLVVLLGAGILLFMLALVWRLYPRTFLHGFFVAAASSSASTSSCSTGSLGFTASRPVRKPTSSNRCSWSSAWGSSPTGCYASEPKTTDARRRRGRR